MIMIMIEVNFMSSLHILYRSEINLNNVAKEGTQTNNKDLLWCVSFIYVFSDIIMSWNQPYGAAVPTFPSPVMYLTQMRTIRVCYQPHRKGSMRIERNWTGHLSINHQGMSSV